MMRVSLRALLLACLALPLAAQAAPKARIPALLERARYVAFGYDLEVGAGRGGHTDSLGGSRGGRPISSGSVGAQLSSNDDRLDVYEAVRGRPGIQLWSSAAADGLAGSLPRLYKSFREEVEAATKAP